MARNFLKRPKAVMDQTPNLALPYILPSQAQKHVTHNEAIRALDAVVQISVVTRALATPPLTPVEGSRYLVPTAATGAWVAAVGKLSAFQDGAWAFYTPRVGWLVWVNDEAAAIVYSATGWVALSSAPSAFATLGINATADTTNRLTVSAPATLLNNAGAGHQLKVNKATVSATASLLYQTAFSGRAEMGTTGDDDFHVKVSADGATWRDGMVISAATGKAAFPAGGVVTSSPTTVTIAVPAQAATIQAALDQFMSIRFEGAAQGIISVANGTYVLAAPLACRHPQPGRIQLKASTAATLPLEADFVGVKTTDEAMVRAKYKVIMECPNIGAWLAADGEGIGLIQDIAFIRTGTTGAPVGVAASRSAGVVLDRCAVFGFASSVTCREQGRVSLSNCQMAYAAAAGISIQAGGFAKVSASLVLASAGNGIDVNQSQFVSDASLRVKTSGGVGLNLSSGSRAQLFGANLAGNTGASMTVSTSSILDATGCTIAGGAGQSALLASDGSTVALNAVTTSGDTTQRAFTASRASVLATSGTHFGPPIFSPALATTANSGAWTF